MFVNIILLIAGLFMIREGSGVISVIGWAFTIGGGIGTVWFLITVLGGLFSNWFDR